MAKPFRNRSRASCRAQGVFIVRSIANQPVKRLSVRQMLDPGQHAA